MKKLYFLLFALISGISFGQNLAENGSFENWTGGVVDSWSSESGTTITEETTTVSDGASAANFEVTTTSQGDTDFRQTISVTNGTTYTVSVDIYQVDSNARARLYADGFRDYSDPNTVGEWQTITYEFTATGDQDLEFGLRFYDVGDWAGNMITSSTIIADNYIVEAATAPTIAITSPEDGATVASTDVDIEFSVQNFNIPADGSVSYSLDGASGTIVASTDPISLTGLSEGEHTFYIELVDINGMQLDPAVNTTITFTVSSVEQVANIAELRAGTIGNVYQLTGEAVITYLTSFRNQKHIEDATAAILIDDDPGVITSSYTLADGITGLTGTLAAFNGLLQFAPLEDPGAPSSSGNTLTPQVVTFADLNADTVSYESELVTVEGISFDTMETNFSNGLELPMLQSGNGFNFRTAFFEDYSTGTIPTVATDVTGVILNRNNGDFFLMARYSTDFSEDVLSVNQFNQNTFSIYPNPAKTDVITISTNNSEVFNVAVYDILGKQVKNATVSNNRLDVSQLNSGMYIVKITQNNNSVTKKLIIE